MLKKIILFFTIFILNLVADVSISGLSEKQTQWLKNHPIITAQNEEDYVPINFNKNNISQGYSIDFMNLIAKKLGIKIIYKTGYTWNEYLEMIKNKEIDIILNIVRTQKRSENMFFTKPYLLSYPFIYSNKKNPINSLDELKGKTLAVPKGYYFEELFRKEYPDINLLTVEHNLDALNSVSSGKADATIGMSFTFEHLIREYFITNVSMTSEIKLKDTSKNFERIGVRNDWEIFKEILDIAISQITYDENKKLKEKWNLNSLIQEKDISYIFTKDELAWLKNKKVIKVYNEKDWGPYNYNENAKPKGYSIDYIKAIAKKLDLEIEFISDISWSEAFKRLKENKIDLILNIAKTKKREELFTFSENNFLKISNGFVLRKDSPNINSFNEIKSMKLAIVKDYFIDEFLEKKYPQIEVMYLKNSTEVVRAVSDGFADIGHGTLGALKHVMLENYITNLKYVKENESNNDLYMATNKKNKQLIFLINKLQNSSFSEDLDEIKKKWFVSTQEHNSSFKLTLKEKQWLDKNEIVLGVDKDYAPMNFLDENRVLKGLSIDFIKALEKEIGKEIKFYIDTWPNILNKAMNHELDGVININENELRKEKFLFSKTYINIPMGVITKSDFKKYEKLDSFKNKILIVKRKTAEVDYLSKKYPGIKLMIVNNYKDALILLGDDKADGIFAPLPVILHHIKKHLISDLKVNIVHFSDTIGYQKIAVKNTQPLLLSIFNKGINQIDLIKRDEIIDKWLKVEYKQNESYTFLWKYLAVAILIILSLAILIIFMRLKIKKEVERRLTIEKQKEEFNSILNGSTTILVLHSASEMFRVNKAFLNFFEVYEDLEAFKKDYVSIFNLFKKVDNPNYISSLNTDLQGWVQELYQKSKKNLKVILTKDGKDEHFLIHVSLVKLNGNDYYLIEMINITQEINQSKEIEDKNRIITEQSKMVALGEMIGNIAHQWRQPLTIISSISSSYKLKKDLKIEIKEEDFIRDMSKITDTSKYLSQTIDDFRNFIKGDKVKEEFNLSSTINKSLNIVGTAMANNYINIQTKMKGNLKIESYENELIQCLSNILNNSKDALKELDEENRVIRVFLDEEDNVVSIIIHDNAGGIPKHLLKKVFEPYFTTKHESQGTGLGLYMCYKIINESLNGDIKILNEEIKSNNKVYMGAKIIIQLPKKLSKN